MKNYLIYISILLTFGIVSCGGDLYDHSEREFPWDNIDPSDFALEVDTLPFSTPMRHYVPGDDATKVFGALHNEQDFERVRANKTRSPWAEDFDLLKNNAFSNPDGPSRAVETIVRGGGVGENYINASRGAASVYQLALLWNIEKDDIYADGAKRILMEWVVTCGGVGGDTNACLAAGLNGYMFACGGELLRNYEGWEEGEFEAFQDWLIDVFYPTNDGFLKNHNGTCYSHYWANWDLVNIASKLAIGIASDRRDIYNEGIIYLQQGLGNGNLTRTVNYMHDVDGLPMGQIQESGRDQGHTLMVVALMGVIGQITWNQGDDIFGYMENRILRGSEYAAAFNVMRRNDLPFHELTRYYGSDCRADPPMTSIAGDPSSRNCWSAIYYHYKYEKGVVDAELFNTYEGVKMQVPEGGPDAGSTSGGFDQPGFGTLMFTREN